MKVHQKKNFVRKNFLQNIFCQDSFIGEKRFIMFIQKKKSRRKVHWKFF